MKQAEARQRRMSIWVVSGFCLFFLTPFLMTMIYAMSQEWGKTILPKGLTSRWFIALVEDEAFLQAVFRSLALSIIVLVIILVVMLPSVMLIVLHFPQLDAKLQGLSLMPYAIPGVVLVTALLKTYAQTGISMLIVLGGALFITGIPVMYTGIRNSMLAINVKELIEASQVLGASPIQTFFKVILPNVRIGVVLVSVMVFSGLFGEYVLTNLLVGGRFETLRIYMLRRMNENGHLASAVMVVYFLVIFLIGLVINYLSKRQLKIYNGEIKTKKVFGIIGKKINFMTEQGVGKGGMS